MESKGNNNDNMSLKLLRADDEQKPQEVDFFRVLPKDVLRIVLRNIPFCDYAALLRVSRSVNNRVLLSLFGSSIYSLLARSYPRPKSKVAIKDYQGSPVKKIQRFLNEANSEMKALDLSMEQREAFFRIILNFPLDLSVNYSHFFNKIELSVHSNLILVSGLLDRAEHFKTLITILVDQFPELLNGPLFARTYTQFARVGRLMYLQSLLEIDGGYVFDVGYCRKEGLISAEFPHNFIGFKCNTQLSVDCLNNEYFEVYQEYKGGDNLEDENYFLTQCPFYTAILNQHEEVALCLIEKVRHFIAVRHLPLAWKLSMTQVVNYTVNHSFRNYGNFISNFTRYNVIPDEETSQYIVTRGVLALKEIVCHVCSYIGHKQGSVYGFFVLGRKYEYLDEILAISRRLEVSEDINIIIELLIEMFEHNSLNVDAHLGFKSFWDLMAKNLMGIKHSCRNRDDLSAVNMVFCGTQHALATHEILLNQFRYQLRYHFPAPEMLDEKDELTLQKFYRLYLQKLVRQWRNITLEDQPSLGNRK